MSIKINTEVLEMMLFFWQSCLEKEKVSDVYLSEIGARKEMEVLYNKDFTAESVRKVLSAITNRELLSEKTKEEGRFWNNNMWMLEDLSLATDLMLAPVKQLGESSFKLSQDKNIEIVFVPGTFETAYIKDNNLYLNFFKLQVDYASENNSLLIENKPFIEYIQEQLNKL